jgi:glycerol uptake facilitator-like aquaporin
MANHPILHTMFESFLILLFEALGTGLFACLWICSSNQVEILDDPPSSLASVSPIAIFLGYFVLLILAARISGAHYNPIVTLAFMLRRDAGQFNKWLGILYMIAQLGGAYVGALIAYYFFGKHGIYLNVYNHWSQCMVAEIVGGFILVMAYLTQTEPAYKLTGDAAITMMIISAAYVVAMSLSPPKADMWSTSSFNPAVAIAEITFSTFDGNAGEMDWTWIFFTFAWLGSLLAVFIFEVLLRSAQRVVEHAEEHEEVEEASQALMD